MNKSSVLFIVFGTMLIVTLHGPFTKTIKDIFPSFMIKHETEQVDLIWRFSFYANLFFSSLGLTSGSMLFARHFKYQFSNASKSLIWLYLLSVILYSISDLYLSINSNGDQVSKYGLIAFAALMFYTTLQSISFQFKEKKERYLNVLLFSFSLCLSTITFYIWQFIFSLFLSNPVLTYQLTVWESWLPNLFIAIIIIRNKTKYD